MKHLFAYLAFLPAEAFARGWHHGYTGRGHSSGGGGGFFGLILAIVLIVWIIRLFRGR